MASDGTTASGAVRPPVGVDALYRSMRTGTVVVPTVRVCASVLVKTNGNSWRVTTKPAFSSLVAMYSADCW